MSLRLPPDPRLTDGMVMLRRSELGDLPAIDEGIHDVDVVRWIGPPHGTAADLLAINEQRWADGSPTLSICDVGGSCVGLVWINVRDDDPSSASVGYFLLPHARGHGLAARAVRLIARWATHELGVTGLRLTTEPENDRSRRVAERSGFRQSAAMPANATIDGRVIDQVVYEYVAEKV